MNNAVELLAADLPEPRYAVQGLIGVGATVFAGAPKSGKSWAMLQVALSVTDGTPAFGRFPVSQGRVLYLALEDSDVRMQSRLRRLLRGRDEMPNELLHISTDWPDADHGGMDELEGFLSDFPDTKMIVIDVQRKFNGMGMSYTKDAAKIDSLNALGKKYGCAIVSVFHLYKGRSISAITDDWTQKVQGSVGVVAAAQAIIGLARDRGATVGLLRVVGKDVIEGDYAMTFNAGLGSWTAGETVEATPAISDERKAVLEVLTANPGRTAPEIGTLLGRKYDAIRRLLWSMVGASQLSRVGGNYYTIAQEEARHQPDPSPQLAFGEKPAITLTSLPTLTAEVKGNRLTLSRNGSHV